MHSSLAAASWPPASAGELGAPRVPSRLTAPLWPSPRTPCSCSALVPARGCSARPVVRAEAVCQDVFDEELNRVGI